MKFNLLSKNNIVAISCVYHTKRYPNILLVYRSQPNIICHKLYPNLSAEQYRNNLHRKQHFNPYPNQNPKCYLGIGSLVAIQCTQRSTHSVAKMCYHTLYVTYSVFTEITIVSYPITCLKHI